MLEYTGGQKVTATVWLIDSDEKPLVPDAGTTTYTVYDHSGNAISGATDVAVTTDDTTTSVPVTIDAADNSIASGKIFEKRTIVLTIEKNGQVHTFRKNYRLVPLLKHSETPDSVRSFLGVANHELPDEDIDLFQAYITVKELFDNPTIDAVLESGDHKEMAANEAIRMQAVLDVIPSLKQRIAQNESDGTFEFARPKLENFNQLEKTARDRYSRAIQLATESTPTNTTMVLTTRETDPITGG